MAVTTMMSCSKDNNQTPDGKNECLIEILDKDITDDGLLNFTYDSENRVNKIEFKFDETQWGGDYTMEESNISYSPAKIVVTGDGSTIFTLDEKERVVKSTTTGYSNPVNYTYNSEGYIETSITGHRITTYNYLNGNLISFVSEYNNYYLIKEVVNIEYDLNGHYVPYSYNFWTTLSDGFHSDQLLYEQGYFGKKSKNLITKVTRDEWSLGNDGEPVTFVDWYSYIHDKVTGKAKSIIIKNSIKNKDGKYKFEGEDYINPTYKCD